MSVTNQNSTEVAAIAAGTRLEPQNYGAKLRVYRFDYTQSGAGDAGSIANLVKLPAGKCRVILPLSRIAFSSLGTARTMDVGWAAHTDPDGSAVVADENGLDDGVDVSSSGSVTPGGTVGDDETYEFNSRGGVNLTAQINDGTFPDSGTLKGYFVVAIE